MISQSKLFHLALLLMLLVVAPSLPAQTSAFTYQGRLLDSNAPASANYDFQFSAYDAASNGTLVGGPIAISNQPVSNGLFTVTLDFGAGVFTGADRWLAIGVKSNGAAAFVTLNGRQKVTPAPYALFAPSAASVSGVLAVSNLPASVALLNGNQTFTGLVQFNNPSNSYTGNGTGLTNVPAFGSNTIYRMTPAVGGLGIYQDMSNAPAVAPGQFGWSAGSPTVFLWAAKGSGSGSSAWGTPISLPGGIETIGFDRQNVPASRWNNPGRFDWYFNGGPEGTRKTNVWNGNQLGDQLWFFHGVNPFSDAGITVPMYGTNHVGTPLLTNADGVAVYNENQFGIQMLSIPDADPVGITNLAPSYDLLTSGAFNFYASINSSFPTGPAWQVPWLSAGLSNYIANPLANSLTVGFPQMTILNSNGVDDPNYKWAFAVQLSPVPSGGIQTYVNGRFRFNAAPGADDTSQLFSVNTGATFNADSRSNNVVTFDDNGWRRTGFTVPNGDYPVLEHASGTPFQIAQSSDSDLAHSVSSQAFTKELVINNGSAAFSIPVSLGSLTNTNNIFKPWVSTNVTLFDTTNHAVDLSIGNTFSSLATLGQNVNFAYATNQSVTDGSTRKETLWVGDGTHGFWFNDTVSGENLRSNGVNAFNGYIPAPSQWVRIVFTYTRYTGMFTNLTVDVTAF